MLDEELFNALKEVETADKAGLCILKPASQNDEDRKNFDYLALRVHKLKDLRFVEFTDKQVIKNHRTNDYCYEMMACRIEYNGKKALAYGSFENYSKSDSKLGATPVFHVDQSLTIQGPVSHSNIAAHSSHVIQRQENADLAQLFNEIINALKADTSISDNERQEKLDDVETLHKEVGREKPRREIIQTLYSNLANTASIVSHMIQLQPLIPGLLS